MNLSVYVPVFGTWLFSHINKGSAIVSLENSEPEFPVFYEGNLYGAGNLKLFHGRLLMACGRCVTNAPTIARAVVRRENLIEIGTVDYDNFTFQPLHENWIYAMGWMGSLEFEGSMESSKHLETTHLDEKKSELVGIEIEGVHFEMMDIKTGEHCLAKSEGYFPDFFSTYCRLSNGLAICAGDHRDWCEAMTFGKFLSEKYQVSLSDNCLVK